jgi:AraC-like DNA-binding protein
MVQPYRFDDSALWSIRPLGRLHKIAHFGKCLCMSWNHDHLAPVETLLFRSDLVKVGSFECGSDHPCFAVSESLDNDVFVLPRKPVWIRRDAGDFRFVEPGALLMHRAGSTLERRRADGFGERTFWFGVHPAVFVDTLRRFGLSTSDMGGAQITNLTTAYRLALLLKKLQQLPCEQLSVEEQVLSVFYAICEARAGQACAPSNGREGTTTRQRRLVDLARAYLDTHLCESVSLDRVAHEAGTSLYHLCRVFRQTMGVTMHEYRTRQRLSRAMQRLIDGDSATLTELALDLGFSSHSHLSRVFQQQVGMSPSSIRASI